MVLTSKVVDADVAAVEAEMNAARSRIEKCKIELQDAEAVLFKLTQKRDGIIRTARQNQLSTAGDRDKGGNVDAEQFFMYQNDAVSHHASQGKKSLIVVDDDEEDNEEVDIFECVGVAKCRRCGQRLPLDVESIEEHALMCDIKASVQESELAAAKVADAASPSSTAATDETVPSKSAKKSRKKGKTSAEEPESSASEKRKSLKVRLSKKEKDTEVPAASRA